MGMISEHFKTKKSAVVESTVAYKVAPTKPDYTGNIIYFQLCVIIELNIVLNVIMYADKSE